MNAIEPFLHNKSIIIWDWNGTLLDDLHVVHGTLCDLLEENQLPAVCIDTHRRKFRFPIRDYYTTLGFDFGITSYEFLSQRFFELLAPRLASVKLFDGVPDFLSETKSRGMTHYILSVAEQNDLRAHVRDLNILHHFDAVCGVGDVLAVSKVERGKQLMHEFKLDPNEVLFIGDTDHDLEVGKTIGVDTLLIAQGHQSFDRLSRVHHQVLETRLAN